MGSPCLTVFATALLLAACARPVSSSDVARTPGSDQRSQRIEPSVNATFETSASRRDDARASNLPVLLRGNTLIYPAGVDPVSTGNGWVNLFITVNPDGSVAAVQVLDSSNPVFNDAAIAAAHSWKFAPHPHAQSLTHRMIVTVPGTNDHYQPTGIDR